MWDLGRSDVLVLAVRFRQRGGACNANQGLPLQCEDHLGCLGMNDVGTCHYWCDPSDPCPSGSGSCTTVHTTMGATISFCL
ncbi:MAG: hypothetical protein ACLP1X_22070 [Polyangiaceae bacterium]